MCGRFTQVVKAVELAALYGVAASGVELQPRWNGAPTQAFLVCRLDAEGRWVLTLTGAAAVIVWRDEIRICPECEGLGHIGDACMADMCPECDGSGELPSLIDDPEPVVAGGELLV